MLEYNLFHGSIYAQSYNLTIKEADVSGRV